MTPKEEKEINKKISESKILQKVSKKFKLETPAEKKLLLENKDLAFRGERRINKSPMTGAVKLETQTYTDLLKKYKP